MERSKQSELALLRDGHSSNPRTEAPGPAQPRQTVRFRRVVRPTIATKRDWRRRQPIHNPVINKVLKIGVWRQSDSSPKHAVIAGFDKHGRFFQRVVRHDFYGNPLPFQSHATSVGHNDVVFRAHWADMSADEVRAEVDRVLRLPQSQRPPL